MVKFLLWLILFILCWPLALLALFLYPIVWLLLLPFRLAGIVVGGVFDFLWTLVTLPARLLRGMSSASPPGVSTGTSLFSAILTRLSLANMRIGTVVGTATPQTCTRPRPLGMDGGRVFSLRVGWRCEAQ